MVLSFFLKIGARTVLDQFSGISFLPYPFAEFDDHVNSPAAGCFHVVGCDVHGRKHDPCPHVRTWVFFAKVMSLRLRTWVFFVYEIM
jgi:hypothetical protein